MPKAEALGYLIVAGVEKVKGTGLEVTVALPRSWMTGRWAGAVAHLHARYPLMTVRLSCMGHPAAEVNLRLIPAFGG
jgi:hypothetical protein